MEEPDRPRPVGDAASRLAREDLGPYSQAELDERIALLEAEIARVKAHALSLDDFRLTGLATAVPLLGSAVLALAVEQGALDGGAAFDLSRIDELFQEDQWGVDAEAAERTEARRAEAQKPAVMQS